MGWICKLLGHRWAGCRCARCGETRGEGHRWVEAENKCEHTCEVCGVTETVPCDWFHCQCKRCGAQRQGHHFWLKKSACEQVCRLCGEERETHDWRHVDRGLDKCAVCGKTHRLTAEEIAERDAQWAESEPYDADADEVTDYPPEQD